jgi:hypothetical protein
MSKPKPPTVPADAQLPPTYIPGMPGSSTSLPPNMDFDAPEPQGMRPATSSDDSWSADAVEPAADDPVEVARTLAAEAGAPPESAAEDPKALAKRLVAEAKAKAQPKEDPKALAKRLVAETKAKQQVDPRALAKRLAAEAKAKAQKNEAKELAKRLVAEAKAKQQTPAPTQPRSLTARAQRKKKLSAADLLANARTTVESTPTVSAAPAAPVAAAPAPVAAAPAPVPTAPAPQELVEQQATPAAEPIDAGAVVESVLQGARIVRVTKPRNADVFNAIWQAHLARGQASNDAALAITSAALLGAAERLNTDNIVAVEAHWAGVKHAVWVDANTGDVLGTAYPAHVYLAGM